MTLSMLFLAATAIPAIALYAIARRTDAAVAARFGQIASFLVFVLLMVGTWSKWLQHARPERWLEAGGALALFALLALLCLIGYGTDRRHWRWLGVAAAGLAFAISAYAIARNIHESSAFFVCVVSVAAVVAHANTMAWCPLKPAQRWLLWGTIGAGIATGVFVDVGKITSPWQDEMLGRLAGAAAIVGGCGTLAMLVLAKLNQRSVPLKMSLAELRELKLTCPRCGEKQKLPLGSGECSGCGLLISVTVRERTPAPEKFGV